MKISFDIILMISIFIGLIIIDAKFSKINKRLDKIEKQQTTCEERK